MLLGLRGELNAETPDIRYLTTLTSSDIALGVAVLRVVNSAGYALPRQVATIAQAVSMIGLRRVAIRVPMR